MRTLKNTLLTIVALLCSISANAHDFEVDGIYYTIMSATEPLTVEVSIRLGYSNTYKGNVAIPESVTYNGNTYSVTGIGNSTFQHCPNLTSVTLPNSVKNIEKSAFTGCTNLVSVTIPNSVETIGTSAFYNCTALTSIAIPNSVTSIESATFMNCSSLANVTLGNSITSIGKNAFYKCSSLTSIDIAHSVESIGENAFFNCSAMTSISIGDGVKTIEKKTFSGCSNLQSITIGSSVTNIGEYAFENCSDLTSLRIPNSVTNIGNSVFNGCSSLKELFIKDGESTLILGSNFTQGTYKGLFYDCPLESLYVGKNLSYSSNKPFSGKETLASVTIGNSVTSIGESLFSGCSNLANITIGNSVAIIGKYAFSGCSSLTSIFIPNSVTSIGTSAFYGCSGFTSITIPNSVTSIDTSAFGYCNSLKKVSIGNSVTSIGDHAFDGCSSLTDIVIPNSVVNIGEYTFMDCAKLSHLTLGNSVTEIGNGAFYSCSKLTDIICRSATPPICGSNVFYRVSTSQCSLEVPKGTQTLYQKSDVWSKFSQMKEVPFKYQVTYSVDGKIYGTDSIACGEAITFPSKEGYTYKPDGDTPYTMPAQDISINGTFTINTYKLAYLIDGKTYMSSYVTYGDAIYPMAHPTKEGYTFSGWSKIPETMPAQDVTVTGTFTVNRYKIVYKVDGVEYASDSVAYNSSIILKKEPIKEGYTFSGWSEIPTTMPASDVTVTGTFAANNYTLTYILDGETFKTETVVFGTVLAAIGVPTKEGYTFSGWSEVPETMPAQDVTIIGKYTINNYTLLYMLDGVEYKKIELEYGASITPESELAKEGYTFSGWSEVPATMPAQDVTVTGSFTANTYKVTYILDGETFKIEEVVYGQVITVLPSPLKEGYTFSGWSEIPETMPAQDVTVVGQFTINSYQLTYLLDKEVYATMHIQFGSPLYLVSNPTKEGYTFSGWSEVPETMPAQDVTVTGSFTANTYKITYILEGETFQTLDVVYGTAIPTPEVPAKEGYNFSGWGELPATMPAQDLTFSGTYSVNKDLKYDLIYMVDGEEYKRVTLSFMDAITLESEPEKEGHTFSGWSEVPEAMPLHDVTVTGTFTANSYTLLYMVDGAEYKKVELEFGAIITTEAEPTKEGYTFGGWSEVPETMPAQDVTVTGSFTVNTYTITYLLDGEVYATENVSYGETVVLKETPTKEGYTFSGWSEVPATMPAQDVTVTGSFTVNTYTITYLLDGEVYATEDVSYGETVFLKETPTKEGYTFSGWSEVPEMMPAQNVTVEGTFTVNRYRVTYMVDGEEYASDSIAYGEAIVLKEIPIKDGYTFSGWSEVPETMPAQDVTVTGSFTVNGIDAVFSDKFVDVYTLQGTLIKRQIAVEELEHELPTGIYIVNGKKMLVR